MQQHSITIYVLQEINNFAFEVIKKWLPSHLRSRNAGTPDCLDLQVETDKGPRDLRMRCSNPDAVKTIISTLRDTVQVNGQNRSDCTSASSSLDVQPDLLAYMQYLCDAGDYAAAGNGGEQQGTGRDGYACASSSLQHGCSTQSLTHQHNLNDTRMQFVTFTNALDTDKECMALPMLRVAPLGFMLTSPRVL